MSTSDPWRWPEDYLDAHHRHWEDAELLFGAGRLANADHLYGLSAECGIKFVLTRAGVCLTWADRVHINQLPSRTRLMSNARRYPALSGLPQLLQNFANWRAEQRYANRFMFNPNFVEQHRRGAEGVRRLVNRVLTEGLR